MTIPMLAEMSLSRRDSAELRRSPQQREKRLRRLFRIQWLGFGALLAGSIALLVVFGPAFAAEHPVLFAVIVAVAVVLHVLELFGLLGGEAVRYREAPEEMRSVLQPDEVDSLARTVASRFGSTEAPNLYVAIDKQANALTANSMLLGFVPRYNAIFLNSYLFRALSREELRAVLVHELAHFHRYIGPFGRNAWLGVLGSVAACVGLFAAMPELSETFFAPLVVWWAPLPFLWVFNVIASLGHRDLEYACDSVAAEVVGAEPMVNALLKMGDRAEIFELVESEMERHLDENPTARSAEIAQALLDRVPDGPVDPDEAQRALRAEPLPDGGKGDKRENRKLLGLLRKNRRLRKALDVMHWSRFDTIRRDGWLDRDELHRYVLSLTRVEHAATHEVTTDHPELELLQTHPSTRKRIVYLYLHHLASGGA